MLANARKNWTDFFKTYISGDYNESGMYSEVDLHELVECSSTILAVEPIASKHQEISIAPDGIDDAEKYPPFIKTVYEFKVTGIIKNESNNNIPDAISVPEVNWEEELGQHKMYYLDDIEESPDYEAYTPTINGIEEAGIIFLEENITDKGGVEFGFPMSFAYESGDMIDEVKAIVQNSETS